MTQITTAASRLTRNVNSRPQETKTWYDADGRPLHSMPADMHYTDGWEPGDAVVCMTSRRNDRDRLTYRGAQDALDRAGETMGAEDYQWLMEDAKPENTQKLIEGIWG